MKKSGNKAAPFIMQAINAIGDDLTLNDVKQLLYTALKTIEKTNSKRTKRTAWANQFAEEAKNKQTEWWDKIKEQTAKLAALKQEQKGDNK